MNLAQTSREEVESLGAGVSDTFDAMMAKINALWNVNHNADGTHGEVTFRTAAGVLLASVASGGVKFYGTASGAGVLAWGVNTLGDWVYGVNSNVADSAGTPVIAPSQDFGTGATIRGKDYAFVINLGTPTGTTFGGTILFGHAFANLPVVTFGLSNQFATGGVFPVIDTIGTGSVRIITSSPVEFPSGGKIYVHVRGY